MFDTVIEARDFLLKPGGAILPDVATLHVAGFGRNATSLPFWDDVYGFEMPCVQKSLSEDAVKTAITRIGLTHSLVTRYTSLLATEQTAARPAGTLLISGDVPLNLPHGWAFDTTMGKQLLKRAAAPPAAAPAQQTDAKARFELATTSVTLPQGATPFFLHLAIGFGLLIIAGMVLMFALPRSGRAA